jgi:vancomycin resistance protein YoaR
VTLVAAAATLVATSAVVAARVTDDRGGRIASGVAIAGVAVGGLTAEEARRLIAARAAPRTGSVAVVAPGMRRPLTVVPIERLAPVPRVADAVRRAARTPTVAFRVRRALGLGGRRDVDLRYRIRREVLESVVRSVARRIDRRPRSARLLVPRGRIRVVPGADGRVADQDGLRRGIASLAAEVQVRVTRIPPRVSDREAEAARERAERLVHRPVTVRAGRRAVVLAPGRLRRALTVQARDGAIVPALSPTEVARMLRPVFRVVERAPRPARFRVRGGRVAVVPSRPGRAIDGAATATAIAARPGAVVRLRTRPVRASLTTAEARRLRITRLVSEFRTPYACCQPRVTNIARAAAVLDGTVLMPGEVFSLNRVLGERTVGRGFVPAPQIVAGRLEDAVGGGISQVATTLFNAAFFAGLRLIEHTPHEFWISRYPPGREATVSWGGPELVFQNDWPAGLLIKVRAGTTGIRVRMYSAPLGRRVETQTSGTAVEGTAFAVAYTRRVLRGSAVRRDERFVWTYRAPPPPG